MKLSFFTNKTDSDPQNGEIEFEQLPEFLQGCAEDDKDTAALWSPSLMDGGKTVGHVKSVEALALDFDHAEPPWGKLSGWDYFAHTTHSHTAADPHWRVVVKLEEPGDPSTWKTQFKVKMQQHDMAMDASCCNPNRSFFVPPTSAEWRINEGRPAKMPAASVALEKERQDFAENADELLSDGKLFWPDVERMMKVLPPSVAGDGGDDRLFDAACCCRSSFRLNLEATMEALRIFNARCKPPWDEDRLAYKAEQAANDKQHTAGELVPKAAREKLRAVAGHVDPAPPVAPELALWVGAAGLVGQVTKVEYLCKELGLRDGRPSLWTADARCGKSTLAAAVALAVAAGRPLWGKLRVLQGAVLYVAGEDLEGVARIWKRLALDQKIAIPADLHVTDILRLAGPNMNPEHLKRALSAHKLVIFDTLRSLSRESGVEENDPAFADGLYTLDKAAEGTGCAMLVLHHNNKSGRSNGTAALFGAAGNHLELTRDEETCVTKGYAAGTRDGLSIRSFSVEANLNSAPPPPDDPDSTGIRLVYSALEGGARKVPPAVDRLAQKLFARLQKADRWLSRPELVHDLDGKPVETKAALEVLEDKVGFQMNGKSAMYHWNPKMTPKS